MGVDTVKKNDDYRFFKRYIQDIVDQLSLMISATVPNMPPPLPNDFSIHSSNDSSRFIQESALLNPIIYPGAIVTYDSLASSIVDMENFINDNSMHPREVLLVFKNAFSDILDYLDRSEGVKVYVPLIRIMEHYVNLLKKAIPPNQDLIFIPFLYILCLAPLNIREDAARLLDKFISILTGDKFGYEEVFALDQILVSIFKCLFSQSCYQRDLISIDENPQELHFAETKSLLKLDLPLEKGETAMAAAGNSAGASSSYDFTGQAVLLLSPFVQALPSNDPGNLDEAKIVLLGIYSILSDEIIQYN